MCCAATALQNEDRSRRANGAQARLPPEQCECRTAGEEGPTTGQVDPVTGV